MTIGDVWRRVEEIQSFAESGDFEVAHIKEDELHQGVLLAIATGECGDPIGLANEALKTRTLGFARWYA